MPSTPSIHGDGPSSNVFLDAIQWGGWMWTDGPSASTNITYLIAPGGIDVTGVFGFGGVSVTWLSYEIAAYQAALQTWANVANITFTQVFDYGQTDLVEFILGDASGVLGVHETPEDASLSDGTAWGAYNFLGAGFTQAGLQLGGYGFITFVHEIGHALGLAHPHDNGGGSGLFPGVSAPFGDLGDNELNQGIFTTMTYNGGWNVLGPPPNENFGWQAGPMAFDIAAIQYLYGANMTYATGDSLYLLGLSDWMQCIWDAGGTDTIGYQGALDVIINLNAATLLNAPGGGGFVSYINGASTSLNDHWSTFTIANNVVIENATGGSGNDNIHLTDQDVNNLINGNGGSDTVWVTYNFGSGYTIQAGSTAANLVMLGAAGTDTLLNAEFVHFADGTTVSTASLIPVNDVLYDFNGNGTSDVLVMNTGSGVLSYGQVNSGSVNWQFIGGLASGWQVLDAGDFNGNVSDDILVQNTSTGVLSYGQVGSGSIAWNFIGGLASGWQVLNVGDFNSNNSDDILVLNASSGVLSYGQVGSGGVAWNFIGGLASGWQVVGVGDFNGNNSDDILVLNASSGVLSYGQIGGGGVTWNFIGGLASGWQVVGVGDFNGDNSDDILVQNTSSGVLSYGQVGSGSVIWNFMGGLASGWQVLQTGDFDGNNVDDILVQDTSSGDLSYGQMSGGALAWQGIGGVASGWVVLT